MKKILLLLIFSTCFLSFPIHSQGENVTYTNLDEAVNAGTIECVASYNGWFSVMVKMKRKNLFIKGIRIEPGVMFESSIGTSTRISVAKVEIPFKEDGTATAFVNSLALVGGKFKGKLGEILSVSMKRMVLSNQKASICNAVRKNKAYSMECGQVALWLDGGDPEMNKIARWVVYPSGTKLFTHSDGYRGLFLAKKSGVDIRKKKMSTDTTLFLVGLRDEKKEFAYFCLDLLKLQGNVGDTPVAIAEHIFKKEELFTVQFAALTLLLLNRHEPVLERIKNGKKDWSCGQLLYMYLDNVPTEKGMVLIRPMLESNFKFSCRRIDRFIKRLKDTQETLDFAKFVMDKGAKEDLRSVNIRDIRRKAAGKILNSKLPGIPAKLMELMKNDPDWKIRLDSANFLRYKKHKEALPEMKKLLKIVPKGYRSRLESIIKEFEKELAKKDPPKKDPDDDTPKKPW